MEKYFLLLSFLAALAHADTPPPGALMIRGATNSTLIGNTGNALNVNVVNSSGTNTVDQGTPASSSDAWPVYLSQPITGTVSVSNFPASQVVTGNVGVTGSVTVQQATGTNLHTVVDSGAVTANIGSTGGLVLNTTLASVIGSASGGSVATNSVLDGGRYLVTPPALSNNQQSSLLLDVSGNLKTLATFNGAQPVLISGTPNVNILNTPNVTVTNPSTNYALETGGNLASINASLNSINTKFTNPLPVSVSNFPSSQNVVVTNTVPISGNVGVTGTVTVSGTVTSNIGTTGGLALNSTLSTISGQLPTSLGQKVSASSLAVVIASDQSPIPITGSITADNASVGATNSTAPGFATEIGAVDGSSNLQHLNITAGGALKVDASATTQPVSGSISVSNFPGTQNVNVTNTVPVSGTFWPAIQPVSQSGSWSVGRTWTLNNAVDNITVSNFPSTYPVTQSTSPWVVSGTVTANIGTSGSLALNTTVAALQVAQNSTTSGQNGTLMQGAVTTGVPSYTTARTSPLSLTTSGALRVDGSAVVQPISASGNLTVVQPTGTNLHTVIDSGSVTLSNQITNYAQETGGNLASINSYVSNLPSIASSSSTTASNTGTISSNTSTIASNTGSILTNQTNGNQKTQVTSTVPSSDTVTTGNLTSLVSVVTIPANGISEGGITVTGTFVGGVQIQGSSTGGMYQVLDTLQSGSWTSNPITVPGFYKFKAANGFQTVNALFSAYTSGTATVRLEGSTAVAYPTISNIPSLGQKLMTGSLPVVIASDQSAISVSQSGTWNLNNISGTISLPTGAATAGNQTTEITRLTSIDTKITTTANGIKVDGSAVTQPVNLTQVGGSALSLGQSIMANSVPVVLASNQSALPVSQSGVWSVGRTWSLNNSTDSIASYLNDGSGNPISSTTGSLNVDVTNVVPVSQSGTWNLTNISGVISLPTGAATDATVANVQGSVGPGSAASKSSLAGGVYNSSPITLTNGQQSAVQLDSSGRLMISGSITATNASIGLVGSAVPLSASFSGYQDQSGNLAPVVLTSTGALPVDGSATVQPVSQSGVWTTARTWNLSAGSDAVTVTQGAAASLSGYWPIALTDGTSKVAVKGASTAPTVADPSLVVAISPNSVIEVTAVPPVDENLTGTITAACPSGSACPVGSTVQITTSGFATLGFETHGTWSATLTQDISYDVNCSVSPSTVLWFQTAAFDTDQNNSIYVTSWGPGLNNDPWTMSIAGAQCARLRASAYTSGTVDVTLDAGVAVSAVWAVTTGNAGSGTTDVGNPVKVGGVYRSSPPTFTDGQRADLQLDSNGRLIIRPLTSADIVTSYLNDGSGNAISSTGGSLHTQITNTVPVSQSGTWTVQPGNTANSTPWLFTINQGGNSATVTASNALKVDGSAVTQPVSGTVTVVAPSTSSAAITRVSNSASSFTLLASNAIRKGVVLYNDSSTTCNVAFAATASSTSFTISLTTHSTYTMTPPIYTGDISSICGAASGSTQITEF